MSPYPITGDVNFDDLARVGLSGFSSAKLLFYFTFLGKHLQHMEGPGLGVKLEL